MKQSPRPFWPLLTVLLGATVLIAACATAAPSPTASPSASPSGEPSQTPAPTPSPTTSGPPTTVTSFAHAAALVLATDPRFANVGPQQFDVIGQCCWYDAVELEDGWEVTVNIGWGDCPAGCINHHRWVFHVDRDGTIELLFEEGDAPVGHDGTPGVGLARATLHVVAGPSCPVETNPPDPECEPQAVVGAEIVVRAPDGGELARAIADQDGRIELQLPAGTYWLEPLPVDGLLGTASPIAFAVWPGGAASYTLYYDTGIR